MPFSEATKLNVRKRAHFKCCLCHALGVEVHHIHPQAEGGDDSEENAAPLCPSCQETYGANSSKRKFIREAREHWYQICHRRYGADEDRLARIERQLDRIIGDTQPQAGKQLSTFGEILSHVYEFRPNPVSKRGVEWFYEVFFQLPVDDEDIQETKRQFIERFGVVTAKRLCGFVLSRTQLDPFAGMTEVEYDSTCAQLFTDVRLLLLQGEGVAVARIDQDGSVRYWPAEQAPK